MRNILILPNFNQPFIENGFLNGVIKHTYQLIDSLESDNVFVIVTSDSFLYKDDKINYIVLSYPSNFGGCSKNDRLKRSGEIKRTIKKLQSVVDIDLVISENHFNASNSFCTGPKLVFFHHTFDNEVFGGTSIMNTQNLLNVSSYLEKNSLCFVSEGQKQTFINGKKILLQRMNKSASFVGMFKNNPQQMIQDLNIEKTFVLDNPLELLDDSVGFTKEGFIFVGRCHPEKKILQIYKKILPLLDELDTTLTICCSTLEDQLKYKEKIKALSSSKVNIFFDIPYIEIMNKVKNSKILLLASKESSSYVAKEAFYYGTAVCHIMPDLYVSVIDDYGTGLFKKTNNAHEIKEFYTSFNSTCDIITNIRKKLSIKTFTTALNDIITKAIHEFNSTNSICSSSKNYHSFDDF